MVVERLVEEIVRTSPEEETELLRKPGLSVSGQPAQAPSEAAEFRRTGLGMWAGSTPSAAQSESHQRSRHTRPRYPLVAPGRPQQGLPSR